MSKHTPGPWLYCEKYQKITTRDDPWQIVVYETGTNEADALLIEAAPEMAELLRDAAQLPGIDDPIIYAWHERAKALLAKIGTDT